MNTAHRFWIAAGLLSSLAGSVLAQATPPAQSQRTAHMQTMHEHMAQQHDKHLSELKAKLQLRADQETAWAAFAQAMRPPAQAMSSLDWATLEKLTTPERIDQMQAFKAQHDEQMQKRAAAAKAFYAVLNTEQKKTMDAQTAHHMAQHFGGYPHHGHSAHHR